MGKTKIEWTATKLEDGTIVSGYTANLWWGCTHASVGCDNCYAETLSNRWGEDIWGNDKPRRAIKSVWNDLNKYQKKAQEAGQVHRVFVGSMMDIFEKPMPLVDSKGQMIPLDDMDESGMTTDDLRQQFFKNISDGMYPNLMFLLLTKRPSNINKYIPEAWKANPPANVMFGTSPVNQETANKLIPQLLRVNGKRFLSVEPQLDSINIQGFLFHGGIHWVINGGESGHNRRPFNLDWAYYLKQQCEATNTPYFFKQIDKVQPEPEDLINSRQFPI